MIHPQSIDISEFDYELPPHRIALYPLQQRHNSKLLVYQNGSIKDVLFADLGEHLPANSHLVFNNTRVVNARIFFPRINGGNIEVFCLEPDDAASGYELSLGSKGSAVWKCFVGGASKWKTGDLHKQVELHGKSLTFTATRLENTDGVFRIRFSWTPKEIPFEEVLQAVGEVPLPPYIKRRAEESDARTYQSQLAERQGSVAAPTASLHFSAELLEGLQKKNIRQSALTLHVGAGTFKPVIAAQLLYHQMHAEWFEVSLDMLENLKQDSFIIPVGTTSLRTLESLYWMGVQCLRGGDPREVSQWEVYDPENLDQVVSKEIAFEALINYMKRNNLKNLYTKTSILIAPGYRFRVAKALITNFHQPKSTLLLLVAAGIGDDWKKVYRHALNNDYRFLSYGDGSLLFFPQG